MPRNARTYTVSQIAEELNVSADTVRRYAGRFASHLSEDASPEAGAVRLFTSADLFVLRRAREYMRSGHTYDQTDEYLVAVQMPEELPEEPSTDLVAVQQVTGALLSLTETMQQQNALLDRTEVQAARLEATEAAQARIASQLDRIENSQSREIERLKREIEELNQRIGTPLFYVLVGAVVVAVIIAGVAIGLIAVSGVMG